VITLGTPVVGASSDRDRRALPAPGLGPRRGRAPPRRGRADAAARPITAIWSRRDGIVAWRPASSARRRAPRISRPLPALGPGPRPRRPGRARRTAPRRRRLTATRTPPPLSSLPVSWYSRCDPTTGASVTTPARFEEDARWIDETSADLCRALGATAAAPPRRAAAERQIAIAVQAAPEEFRRRRVLGYDAGGALVMLRQGTNDLVCLATLPPTRACAWPAMRSRSSRS